MALALVCAVLLVPRFLNSPETIAVTENPASEIFEPSDVENISEIEITEPATDATEPSQTENTYPVAPSPTDAPEETPAPTPAPVIRPQYTELIEQFTNEDIVGFLEIPGTSVSYYVVQYADNEFYLYHDINKKPSSAGWIFLDYENDVALEDYHTVIYGHNMKADTMFHSIRYYRSYDYFLQHRYITFNTLYADQKWEVFSFYKTDTSFFYTRVLFPNRKVFFNLASQFKEKSMYETGVPITEDDRVLTLSTCTNESENTRYVLHAKLIRE